MMQSGKWRKKPGCEQTAKNENDMPEGSQTVRIVREGISCWLEDDQIDYNSRMYLASLPAVETKE